MILPKLTGGAFGIASLLLMLGAGAAGAKAQEVSDQEVTDQGVTDQGVADVGVADQDAAPPKIETASEVVTKDPKTGDIVVREQGVASWYGRAWRGRRTASGTRFDDRALTAAHMWLPFATRARVTNKQNGRSVDVVVTDRGPYHEGRIIDLSAKAAELLGIKRCGTAEVTVNAQL